MTTTIQVNDDTLDLLKKYKSQTRAETYDETIKNLMRLGNYAKSFRGCLGKVTRAELLKDLRDKKNRI